MVTLRYNPLKGSLRHGVRSGHGEASTASRGVPTSGLPSAPAGDASGEARCYMPLIVVVALPYQRSR